MTEKRLILKDFASLLGAGTSREIGRDHITNTNVSLGDSFLNMSSLDFGPMGMFSSMGTKRSKMLAFLANDPATLCEFPSLDLFAGDMPDLSTPLSGIWLTSQNFSHRRNSLPNLLPSIPNIQVDAFSPLLACVGEVSQAVEINGSKAGVFLEYIKVFDRNIQEKGPKNLAEPIIWTRSSCPQAPAAILRSFVLSFASLLEIRLKACANLTLHHSLNSVAFLSTSSTIGIKSVATSFESLTSNGKESHIVSSVNGDDELVLPLLFKASVIVIIREESIELNLVSNGEIRGTFCNSAVPLLKRVEVTLDTSSLIAGMMESVQNVIARVMATSAAISSDERVSPSKSGNTNISMRRASTGAMPSQTTRFSVSTFGATEALSLNGNDSQGIPLAKSQVSYASMALMNSLKGSKSRQSSSSGRYGSQNNDNLTRNASFNGSSLGDFTLSSQRKSQSEQLRLLGSTTFGKPIASLLEFSKRNATFDEPIRRSQSSILEPVSLTKNDPIGSKRRSSTPEDQLRAFCTEVSREPGVSPFHGRKKYSCFDFPVLVRACASTNSITSNLSSSECSSRNMSLERSHHCNFEIDYERRRVSLSLSSMRRSSLSSGSLPKTKAA